MSRAVIIHAFGDPSTFMLEDRAVEAPGPGKIAIRIHAAGISFVDVLVAAGEYQLKPPLPFIPGSEFAGVITAVGEGVDPARIGERVLGSAFGAAIAEDTVIPAKLAAPIPDGMRFEEAAVFRVSYATAYHALVQRGTLKAGETVLVLGAGGAVGYAAIEVAKALGAVVIGSASTDAKRALAMQAGADATVDSRSESWRDDVKAANHGKPVDVVIDPVGGSATEPAFRSLAWNGRLLVIGFAGGSIAKLPVNLALLKGASLIGVDVRQFGEYEPELAAANVTALFALYEAGHLHPPVAKTYPLDDFVAAMVEARSGETAGRIVLTMR
ncbi:NADPH:quinone oxidoreductase family protein [Sphingomonas immobilis]|uniref:NADPH:quinone oxidoreductase family protein n=1 Tax=Sphingomonas immobilis TaxID=3063997 RepID=A0ABT8ZWY0_9SPHN|nr:NADPH:quinone oxidoreductase family protein [Sphingomonas sp. CA1-15]MDO7842066.1 NADPH:quinone oxidoreductase family protein [Sphingomonas sp. CA1-15]